MKNKISKFAILLVALVTPSLLHAQSSTWTNSSGSGNWFTAANWTNHVVASGQDSIATFLDANQFNTITLDQPVTIGTLVFAPKTSSTNYTLYSLAGNNTLTLQTSTGNPVISVVTNGPILGVPISSSQMVMITNEFGSKLSNQPWALTNQANNFAGGLTIAGEGTFFTTNTTSVPSLGGSQPIVLGAAPGGTQSGFAVTTTNAAGSLTNADGSPMIQIPNNFTFQSVHAFYGFTFLPTTSGVSTNSQPVNITGSVTLNQGTTANHDIYPVSQPLMISGVVSGGSTVGLGVNGSAPLTLSNPNNIYSGNVNIVGANSTLGVNSDGAFGYVQNGIIFAAAGTLRIDAPFTTVRDFTLTATAKINVQTNLFEIDNQTFQGWSIHGAGGLTVSGSAAGGGELLLTGANPFTGAITVNGGTLFNANGSSLGSSIGATVATNAVWVCDTVSMPSIPTFTVNNGGLLIFSNGTPSLSGTVSLVDNGTLDVSAVSGGFTLASGQTLRGSGWVNGPFTAASGALIPSPGALGTAGTLSFTNGLTLNGQQIQFDLSTNTVEGSGTNDEIVVNGNLTLGGGETILINYINGSLSAGTYKIIKYTGTLNGTFATAISYPNVTINNGSGTSDYVTLTVGAGGSSAPAALFWKGDGSANAWDINTTANWVTNFANAPLVYTDPGQVTFNDFGSNNVPVTLNTTVIPSAVTFNITNHAYALSGSGYIHGITSLTINGGNALTNALQCDFTGGTVVNNGSTLVLGNGGTTGAVGSGNISLGTNGQVIVNQSGTVTLSQKISGAVVNTNVVPTPALVQNGSGTTTLSGIADNTWLKGVVNSGTLVLAKTSSGTVHSVTNTTINGGTLQLGGTGGDQIQNGATVTMNGGTFDIAGNSETFNALSAMGGNATLEDSIGGATLTLTNGLAVTNGTLNISANVSVSADKGFTIYNGGTVNLQSGNVKQTGTPNAMSSGGVFNMTGGSFSSGTWGIGTGGTNALPAIINISGGTFINTGEFFQGNAGPTVVTFSGSAVVTLNQFDFGSTGPLTNWFNGGTVACNYVKQKGGGGISVWYLNGGTIQALESVASFFPNGFQFGWLPTQVVYVSTNGAIFDCQSFNTGVQFNLLHDPALGTAFDGGLTKLGSGSLTLFGTNTFNGSLTNSAGTLILNNNGSYNHVVIGDNAINQINLVAAGTSLTNNTLTAGLSGSGTQTLNFNLGTFGTPTVPLIVVNGAVANNGNVVVTLTAPVLSPGTIPLFSYGSMDPVNFASTWSLTPVPYFTLTLTNDTVHKLVSAIVVPGVTPKWKGNVSSAWDTTTLNWTSNGIAAAYYEPSAPGEPVTFDDTATRFTVDISTATVNPAFIQMTNNNNNYTITGSLGIGGTGALIKSGTGSLILNNAPGANTYSGITMVSGGSLVVGAATVLSSSSAMTFNNSTLNLGTNSYNEACGGLTLNNSSLLGNGTLTSSGPVIFNNPSNLVVGATFAGAMSLQQNGTGEILLMNADTYSGASSINSGTIRVQNGSALSGAITIYSGARLIVDGSLEIPVSIAPSGSGPDGQGCLVATNGLALLDQGPVSMHAPCTFYAAAGATLQFAGSSGNGTVLYNNNFTKTGPGDMVLGGSSGNKVASGAGNTVVVAAGRLISTNCGVVGSVTVNSGATVAGTGAFSGGINVLAGGNLTPNIYGTIETMTCSGGACLTNAGAITLQINKNATATNADQINVTGTFVNTGTVTVVTNAAMTLPLSAGDSFKLFTLTNYTQLTGLVPTLSVLPDGLAWTNQLAVNGKIAVVSSGPKIFTNPTGITSINLNGSNLVITGTNGQAGAAYYLLGTTNLTLPLNQWSVLATNVLGAAGNYTFTGTNAVIPGAGQQFYILSNTNN